MSKKIYYAHCKSIYGTAQENRDILLLSALGFTVLNPSAQVIRKRLEAWQKANPDENVMDFFEILVLECDCLAFRGLPFTNLIPAGVFREVQCALDNGKPVIELPTNILGRGLDYKETVAYLMEAGER